MRRQLKLMHPIAIAEDQKTLERGGDTHRWHLVYSDNPAALPGNRRAAGNDKLARVKKNLPVAARVVRCSYWVSHLQRCSKIIGPRCKVVVLHIDRPVRIHRC